MLHCHVYGLCWRELAVVLVWHSLTFSHLVWDLTVSLSFSVTHTEGLTVYITAFMYCLQHVFPCFMIFIVLFICTAFILFFILNFSLLSVATCDTNALARDRESKRGKVMCSMGKWAFNLITSISWIQVRILIFIERLPTTKEAYIKRRTHRFISPAGWHPWSKPFPDLWYWFQEKVCN